MTEQQCLFKLGINSISQVVVGVQQGAIFAMEYIEKVLEKLKEWARELIEALLGPQTQPEAEPIPVPVDDLQRRRKC
ncbi:hypothetical protein ACL6C3_09615 [Capilliphycus salinus ALCB114379]|uniref:hypothetical protein n=1 Tax=Capilliphycus salinus TaxID=2768948 RepID=UPI0039A62C80